VGARALPSLAPVADAAAARLVGREPHRRALRSAFEASRAGRPVTVRVWGPSGAGKSSLVQSFLDDLTARGEAVVLRGRAYERESVPYKAVDSWMDALSRHLLLRSYRGDRLELPKDVSALARLFPVLQRVPDIEVEPAQTVVDPHRTRRQAFAALCHLLASLARGQPAVLYLDDAQWGDADSAALLVDLVRPPNAPPVLLVMTYRDAEARTSPFLNELGARWPDGAEALEVRVGPLEPDEARRLALALLGSDGDAARATAASAARESGGSPFLLRTGR